MTSYALSLTVVVVDSPRLMAVMCRKNGGKQAGKATGQKCYRDEHDKNNVVYGKGRMCSWHFV